jgi:predicted ester cyclase
LLICGIKAAGKRVQVPDFAIWRFEDGKVVEISTIQDQFALLRQVGYLTGNLYLP